MASLLSSSLGMGLKSGGRSGGSNHGGHVVEYNVDKDPELERIRQAVAELQEKGSYTGEPLEKTPTAIKSIPKLIVELERRAPSEDQWKKKAEALYQAFTSSPKSPSFVEFTSMIESMMPLTPSQTKDAISLLDQRSRVQQRLRASHSSPGSSHLRHSTHDPSTTSSSSNIDNFARGGKPSVREQLRGLQRDGGKGLSKPARTNFPKMTGLDSPKNRHYISSTLSASKPLRTPKKARGGAASPSPGGSALKGGSGGKKRAKASGVDGISLTDLMSPHKYKEVKGNVRSLLSSLRSHMRRRALTLTGLFALWDGNRDGLVSKRDVQKGLYNFGIETTTEEINDFFSHLDRKGTGRIGIDELQALLKYKTRFGAPPVCSSSPRAQIRLSIVPPKNGSPLASNRSLGSGTKISDEEKSFLEKEEERVHRIYRRLSVTDTGSHEQFVKMRHEDRVLGDGSRGKEGAADPTPSAIIARIKSRMKRQTMQIAQLFSYCDADRSGSISRMELADGLRHLGLELTAKQLTSLWRAMDVDRDGSIDYTEFKLALNATGMGPSMALISHTQVEENIGAPRAVARVVPQRLVQLRKKLHAAAYTMDGSDLHQLFLRLDIHGTGRLPKERLLHAIRSVFPMKVEELNAVYKLIDPKNRGDVGYEEFEHFINQKGGVNERGYVLGEHHKMSSGKTDKSLEELLTVMQRQQQRTILFNPPLFSGVQVSTSGEDGAKELVLQLRLLGFELSTKEGELLIDTFGYDSRGFKKLHRVLVAKKIIAMSYISNLDDFLASFSTLDADDFGMLDRGQFSTILTKIVDLNAVEKRLLLKILDFDETNLIPYREIFEFAWDKKAASKGTPTGAKKMLTLMAPRNDSYASRLTSKLMKLKHLVSRNDAAGGVLKLDFLRKMDRNLDGVLTRDELFQGLNTEAKLDGVYMSKEQVEEMLDCFNANGSGVLKLSKLEKFERLDQLRCKLKAATYSHVGQDIKFLFRILTRGNEEEGIDLQEFVETLNRMCRLSGPELGMLLKQVDVNDDNTIDKDEFLSFLQDIRVL